jgi:hypothetical protein
MHQSPAHQRLPLQLPLYLLLWLALWTAARLQIGLELTLLPTLQQATSLAEMNDGYMGQMSDTFKLRLYNAAYHLSVSVSFLNKTHAKDNSWNASRYVSILSIVSIFDYPAANSRIRTWSLFILLVSDV